MSEAGPVPLSDDSVPSAVPSGSALRMSSGATEALKISAQVGLDLSQKYKELLSAVTAQYDQEQRARESMVSQQIPSSLQNSNIGASATVPQPLSHRQLPQGATQPSPSVLQSAQLNATEPLPSLSLNFLPDVNFSDSTHSSHGTQLSSSAVISLPSPSSILDNSQMARSSTVLRPQRMYTQDFLDNLVARQKEALDTATKNADKICQEKEVLIRKLQAQCRELEESCLRREREMDDDLSSARRELVALKAELAKAQEEAKLTEERLVGEMRAAYREKFNEIKQNYELSLSQVREWAKQEVDRIRASQVDEMEKKQHQIEALHHTTDDRVLAIKKEVEELLASLRTQCQVQMARHESSERKLEELKQKNQEERLELEAQLNSIREDVERTRTEKAQQEADLEQLRKDRQNGFATKLDRFVSDQDLEREQMEEHIVQLETTLAESERERIEQAKVATVDIRNLYNHFVQGQNALVELNESVEKAQKELSRRQEEEKTLTTEIAALEEEVAALRRNEEYFQTEVDRLDRVMITRMTMEAGRSES